MARDELKFVSFDITPFFKETLLVYANQSFIVVDSNNYLCSKGQ